MKSGSGSVDATRFHTRQSPSGQVFGTWSRSEWQVASVYRIVVDLLQLSLLLHHVAFAFAVVLVRPGLENKVASSNITSFA